MLILQRVVFANNSPPVPLLYTCLVNGEVPFETRDIFEMFEFHLWNISCTGCGHLAYVDSVWYVVY